MKKWIIPGAIAFLLIGNACGSKDECGMDGTGCHGTKIVWCEDDNNNEPQEYDCKKDGLTCGQLDDGSYDCVVACKAAEVGKLVDTTCTDNATLDGFSCEISPNFLVINSGEGFFYQPKTMNCIHGCANDACIKLHPDEFNDCDENYVPSCAGTVISYCHKGKVETRDCNAKHESQWTCDYVDENAECVEIKEPEQPEES